MLNRLTKFLVLKISTYLSSTKTNHFNEIILSYLTAIFML